jgi:hypothetical protein
MMITKQALYLKLDEAAAMLQAKRKYYHDRDRMELVAMGYCILGGHRLKSLNERHLFYRCTIAICTAYQIEIGHRLKSGRVNKHYNDSLSFLNTELPESYQLTTVPSNEKDLDNKEYAHYLLASSGLTARERQVVDMRFTDGLRFVAIGEKIGFTRTTAQNILNKALGKMKRNTI